jgi:hypothetical protein
MEASVQLEVFGRPMTPRRTQASPPPLSASRTAALRRVRRNAIQDKDFRALDGRESDSATVHRPEHGGLPARELPSTLVELELTREQTGSASGSLFAGGSLTIAEGDNGRPCRTARVALDGEESP